MEKVIADLARTPPGGWNDALNHAAWMLGHWVAAGAVEQYGCGAGASGSSAGRAVRRTGAESPLLYEVDRRITPAGGASARRQSLL